MESFKEELKRTQKERNDRHTFSSAPPPDHPVSDTPEPSIATELEIKDEPNELMFDMLEGGDSISTNLYVGKYPLEFHNGSLKRT